MHVRLDFSFGPSGRDVRIRTDSFRCALRSGRSRLPRRTGKNDPKEKSAVLEEAEHWSLTTLRNKLIKIGAKVVRHGRNITFQLAEVAISRALFADILGLIDGLRPRPAPT